MEIGLSSAAFYGRLETEEAAAHLRAFPLDFCEIFLETFSEYTPAFGGVLKEALGSLPCRSIHVKGTQFEPDLFGASCRQQGDAFALLTGALAAAQLLGARYYVFHGPSTVHHALAPLAIPRLQETLASLLALCQAHGVVLCWENVSWCTLKTPQDASALGEAFPEVSFVLDLKQALRARQDPFALLTAMGDRLRHVHVLDWDEGGNLCLPGQGCFDFPRLKKALEALGYTGGILLEPYAQQALDEEALRRSLEYLSLVFR